MTQWVKHLLREPDNHNSIPRTHVEVEGQSQVPRVLP